MDEIIQALEASGLSYEVIEDGDSEGQTVVYIATKFTL